MLATDIDHSVKDEDTIASETYDEESRQSGVVVANKKKQETRKKNFLIAGVLGLVIVTGIILALVLVASDRRSEPAFAQDEPSSLVFEYQLADTFAPVSAASLLYRGAATDRTSSSWDTQVGFVDDDGCVDFVRYSTDDDQEETQVKNQRPLCNDYNTKDVHSLHSSENYSVVAHGNSVEVWGFFSNPAYPDITTWAGIPTGGPGANVIFRPDIPGFGKKVQQLSEDRLVVLSDEAVHSFKMSEYTENAYKWTESMRWEGAIGFDVDAERTTLAIYDTEKITVFDLEDADWYQDSYDPTVHFSPKEITSIAVSNRGTRIHVVTDHGFDVVTVISLLTDNIKGFNTPTILAGDIVYSVESGCMFNIRNGQYLSIQIKDIDDIFNVQVAGDRIMVLLERDGVKTVDIYEK
eukprot:CAMPEP_0119011178 /NCGR_PEP_ID=MMETSP1176-20130426/5500_1 /TAXON_ID=265551 /ORGANISM="Synedropsis recta cf, Strain CCMP1620" /LENGTH=407 /DNA_ID=CAMNT_0006963957 /DNA_START=46 /DNA_END=1269 /DNA_ORIENTATION=+